MSSAKETSRNVAVLTLGCARNETDSEELAARLAKGGWKVTTDGDGADVIMVNTCGFIEQAKQESIDTLLAAADTGAKVVATGCLAERYGKDLAENLPEANAVLGFDHYPDIAGRLDDIVAGREVASHTPTDRRKLLPISPAKRQDASVVVPGHQPSDRAEQAKSVDAEGAPQHIQVMRHRLDSGPVANLKIASGCDRRCSFCAIPSFRGAFVSRLPEEIVAEAQWLAQQGVKELNLVSENTTSYGKDLGNPAALEGVLESLAAIDGIEWIRLSYLQPAELRPDLIVAMARLDKVVPYFDLSFQHSSAEVLRRMRRFGSTETFLALLEQIRNLDAEAGARTNVIVGFPGETEQDVAELEHFLTEARLDAVGVFAYSDEDGTSAVDLDGHVDEDEINARVERIASLVDNLVTERASERIGEIVSVLVEQVEDDGVDGRAAHQAPEVDGTVALVGHVDGLQPGDIVAARVVDSHGVDLIADVDTNAEVHKGSD
ncbi:30S ribosomal protein S12 methylthiotransferase RimO [Natronoglycomyces albus]|uniref:Ribosomal protein uS12 methylthiotransferase RimO n=1 Tax=Natronoglycomyces albus TaxID=2811108 RepID=A0A895XG43_9ACTN|nr:30S ribosomal protein S12 methylthiotransferase RimO [Natronoglycomyces albus]QSB04304.1 30S ribosomal protein S12 methylthiotransferase RimO [Natronoglycomyces albus]